MEREPVDDLLQVLDIAHVGGDDEAVVTRHAMALDHLRRAAGRTSLSPQR